jgi:hypothetical protein
MRCSFFDEGAAPYPFGYDGLLANGHLLTARAVDSGGKSRTAVALIEVTADWY